MKKGYIITWDALIALSFVLFLMLGFIGLEYAIQIGRGGTTFERLHSVAENAVDTTSKEGLLEEIGRQWALKNISYAANLTRDNFDRLVPPQMGYRLEIVDGKNVTPIYSTGIDRPPEKGSTDQTRALRMITGYKENSSKFGWAARAWMIENYSWVSRRVSNLTACCTTYPDTVVWYPSATGGNTFYFMVPGSAGLSSAVFNVTWAIASTTTSTTTTTTTSTSTTTTTIPGECHVCPASDDCVVGIGWHETSFDNYNYHKMTVPHSCAMQLRVYTGDVDRDTSPAGTNLYNLYVNYLGESCPCVGLGDWTTNGCFCECQRPDTDPMPWAWHCKAISKGRDFTGLEVACPITLPAAGTYQVMVDCFNETNGFNYCPSDYYIYATSADPDCQFGNLVIP